MRQDVPGSKKQVTYIELGHICSIIPGVFVLKVQPTSLDIYGVICLSTKFGPRQKGKDHFQEKERCVRQGTENNF